MKNAVVVCHQGIGDLIAMSGGIIYLIQFYNKINLICKDKNLKHLKTFFQNQNINFITIDHNLEFKETKNKIVNYFNNTSNDIFISGGCFNYLKQYTRITIHIPKYINENLNKIQGYNVNNYIYNMISNFYNDIKLSIDICCDFFPFISNEKSIKLYNLISKYYIIFIQLTSSDNKKLNISNLLNKYLDNNNTILICNDENLYEKHTEKYNLCNYFIHKNFVDYYDTIVNSNEIYVIDSCFSCLIMPLIINKKIKTEKIQIINRNNSYKQLNLFN